MKWIIRRWLPAGSGSILRFSFSNRYSNGTIRSGNGNYTGKTMIKKDRDHFYSFGKRPWRLSSIVHSLMTEGFFIKEELLDLRKFGCHLQVTLQSNKTRGVVYIKRFVRTRFVDCKWLSLGKTTGWHRKEIRLYFSFGDGGITGRGQVSGSRDDCRTLQIE